MNNNIRNEMEKAFIKIMILLFLFPIFYSTRAQQIDSLPQKTKDLLIEAQRKKFNKKGNSSKFDPKDYYPLQVGNYWEYEVYDEYMKPYFKQYDYVRNDTIMKNLKKYFKIEEIFDFMSSTPYFYKRFVYYRKDDSGNIFLYDPNMNCEGLTDKFNTKIDEIFKSWKYKNSICDSFRIFGVLKDTGIENGILWKYIRYSDTLYLPAAIFFSHEYFYDGIGALLIKQHWTSQYLVGAIIGNDTLGKITAISEKSDRNIYNYVIFQNYPNPFNPNTKIMYQLSNSAKVNVRIYDIIGREVYSINKEKEQPGEYIIEWNGKNSIGNNVSSGVYFYTLEIIPTNRDPPFIQTHKMLLIR